MLSQIEKVRDLVRKFSTAMLVTHSGPAGVRARPMAIAGVEDNGQVWFMSGRATEKIDEINDNHRVDVICQNESVFLSISGRARLEKDRAEVERLWKPAYKVWLPAGMDDPNLILIQVTPDAVEYWDNSGLNGVKFLFESIRALALGTTPEPHEGEQHGRVQMSGVSRD